MSIIQECPKCSKKVRVPTDRGKIKITCRGKDCSRAWVYNPNPLTKKEEQSPTRKTDEPKHKSSKLKQPLEIQIHFRCSKTAGHFNVILEWNKELRFYEFVDAVKNDETQGDFDIISNKGIQKNLNFNPDQILWDGFFCAHCYHDDEQAGSFVRCGHCHEFVCGSNIYINSKNERMFECHEECGGGGKLQGSIDNFDAKEHSDDDLMLKSTDFTAKKLTHRR